MRSTVIAAFLVLLALNIFGQNNLATPRVTKRSFPTNINFENFKTINAFDGKVVAYNGVIEKSEISNKETPFYKVRIVDSGYLWTILMFEIIYLKLEIRLGLLDICDPYLKY
jgi:hypothetical protein